MITAAAKKGRIIQVIGSTFDVEFEEGHLPDIYNAVRVQTDLKGIHIDLVGEVQQHLGGSRVRCVALGSTDGLMRRGRCHRHGCRRNGAGWSRYAGPGV